MHLADQSNRAREILGERYRIVRQIGAGAAALVYQAEDLKHGRDVAIKILRPDVAAAFARASVDVFSGQFGEGLDRLRRAVDQLAPGDPFAAWWLAQTAAYAGNDAEARSYARQVAGLNAGFWSDWCALFDLALVG